MKNFFKKLSFVLAVAMVLTSITPATASAAARNYIYKSGKDSALTSVNVWFGDKATDLNVKINGKKNVAGTWKVGNAKVATVDQNGVITPVANGTTTVKFTAKTGEAVKVQVVVGTRVKTVKPYLADDAEKTALTELALNIGDEKEIKLGLGVSATAAKAGAKTTSMVTAAKVDGTAVEVVKGAGQRTFTVKAVEAGEATITIGAHKTTALVEAGKFFKSAEIKVTVEEATGIASFEATGVNEFTLKSATPVSTGASVTLSKPGTASVVGTAKWSDDRTVCIFTTTAKITAGTYTATLKDGEAVDTATAVAEDEKVAEIVIKDDVALTGPNTAGNAQVKCYVYYDVLNQYGDSVRTGNTVNWTVSTGVFDENKAEGKLTIYKDDNKNTGTESFTYGTQIYITGVHVKSGVSQTKLVTTGMEQSLDSISIEGFAKVNGTEKLDTLPANFKTNEYVLLYLAQDQNGNALDSTGDFVANKKVTFIVDNVMFVSSDLDDEGTLEIDGVLYNTITLVPGTYVQEGGTVTFTAISNVTGKNTAKTFSSEAGQILTKFVIEEPTDIIADGETAVIPFKAVDQNGNDITSYDVLVEEKSGLTLTSSVGYFRLVEKNDGTAKLLYTDPDMTWGNNAEDGIDRVISLTSVVIGGNASNLLLNIKDKARPSAISQVKKNETVLELASWTYGVNNGSFLYLDQYGREMKTATGALTDNGWFAYSGNAATRKDGKPGIKVVVATTDGAIIGTASAPAVSASNKVEYVITSGDAITFNASEGVATNKVESLEFYIVEEEDTNKWTEISAKKRVSYTVVDISQVTNITAKEISKLYVTSTKSASPYGGTLAAGTDIKATGTPGTHNVKVYVTGTYKGTSLYIPAAYLTVSGTGIIADGIATTASIDIYGNPYVAVGVVASKTLKAEDFYDLSLYNAPRKDATAKLNISVNAVSGGVIVADDVKTVLAPTLTMSDAQPYVVSVNLPETAVISASKTAISGTTTMLSTANYYWETVDQYGVKITTTSNSVIADIVENASGIAENSFSVSNNGTNAVVNGAERGDTFVATFTFTHAGTNTSVTAKVTFTVGADTQAVYQSQAAADLQKVLQSYLESLR